MIVRRSACVEADGLRDIRGGGVVHDELCLVEPSEAMREEFIAYCMEFRAAGEPFVHKALGPARKDFASLVAAWRRQAEESGCAEGSAPVMHYWLVRGQEIIGTARLRPRLNAVLLRGGGQIGYDIRPSQRGKGYATRLLGMVLERARAAGLSRALVTCEKGNTASARVIVKNGGMLENEVAIEEEGVTMQRYWIEL
jgi:predicted acetyltransferase